MVVVYCVGQRALSNPLCTQNLCSFLSLATTQICFQNEISRMSTKPPRNVENDRDSNKTPSLRRTGFGTRRQSYLIAYRNLIRPLELTPSFGLKNESLCCNLCKTLHQLRKGDRMVESWIIEKVETVKSEVNARNSIH